MSSIGDFLQDLFCGSIAGVANCISGYPFDSIKVRMQTTTEPGLRMVTVMSRTVKNEGFFAFYKGVEPMLLTVPLINSIIFAAYEFSKNMMGVKSEKDFTFR